MIIALARGETVKRAAALGGISERTLQRRMAEPQFRAQVLEARQVMVDRGVGLLADLGVEAGRTLHRLLKSKRPSVALGAARTILEMGPKWREAGELAQRWTDLEARFAEALAAGKLPETKAPSSSIAQGPAT
jgi:hypothetical protein